MKKLNKLHKKKNVTREVIQGGNVMQRIRGFDLKNNHNAKARARGGGRLSSNLLARFEGEAPVPMNTSRSSHNGRVVLTVR
jgi:hypothetical protein